MRFPDLTRRTVIAIFATVASLAAVSATSNLASEALQPQAKVGGTLQTAIEWGRLIGGLVGFFGMLLTAFGLWMYARAQSRLKVAEAQEKTIEVYKEQISAMDEREKRRETERKENIEIFARQEKELAGLRTRTDLSEVLKSIQAMMQTQNQLLEMKRQHDSMIVDSLTKAVHAGDEKYKQMTDLITLVIQKGEAREEQSLKVLSGMLEQSGIAQSSTLEQSKQNFGMMQQLLKSVDLLSRRFGAVETKVEGVKQAVEGNAAEPEQDKQERRRQPRN